MSEMSKNEKYALIYGGGFISGVSVVGTCYTVYKMVQSKCPKVEPVVFPGQTGGFSEDVLRYLEANMSAQEYEALKRFGSCFDFSKVSVEEQRSLAWQVHNSAARRPLIRKMFYEEFVDSSHKFQKIALDTSPEMAQKLFGMNAGGVHYTKDGKEIIGMLPERVKPSTFLHETLHALQKRLGRGPIQAGNGYLDYCLEHAMEAEAIALSNLLEPRNEMAKNIINKIQNFYAQGLVYDQLGNIAGVRPGWEQKFIRNGIDVKDLKGARDLLQMRADQHVMGIIMKVYLAQTPQERARILNGYGINYDAAEFRQMCEQGESWMLYYRNQHVRNGRYTYNNPQEEWQAAQSKIEEMNKYYSKKYRTFIQEGDALKPFIDINVGVSEYQRAQIDAANRARGAQDAGKNYEQSDAPVRTGKKAPQKGSSQAAQAASGRGGSSVVGRGIRRPGNSGVPVPASTPRRTPKNRKFRKFIRNPLIKVFTAGRV